MEEKKTSLWAHAGVNGAILGVILSIYSIILYFLGYTFNKPAGYLSLFLFFAFVLWSSISYRKAKGSLTYGQALGYGTLVGLFSSIISGLFTYLMFAVIAPDLMDGLIAFNEQELMNSGLTDDQVEQMMEMQSGLFTPLIQSLLSVLNSTIMAFIFSLITSIFARKKPQEGFAGAMSGIDD